MSNRLLLTRYSFNAANRVPEQSQWWRTAVFYEIYIRSFQDSNNDGVGDLRGIEKRLPYLKQLGVDAIWITPFYPSPMADFGYDVSDYTGVASIFGDMADFDQLVQAAHQLDMRVVIDLVLNHTSDQHPWFVESRSSRSNLKRDWYVWAEGKANGEPPNNWTSFFGGSAWKWDETTAQYYLHLFLDQQPDLNWRNPEVVQAIDEVLHFWLQKGVDGFRLDAITFLIKHPEYPDMPEVANATGADLVQYHVHVHNQPDLHPVLRNIRKVVDAYPGDRVLIGETVPLYPSQLNDFYGKDLDEIQLPMIILPIFTGWQAKAMRDTLIGFYAALPDGATPHFVFSNHDDKRLITRYGVEHHRSVAMLLLTLSGSPMLYYGDEIAMSDGEIPPENRLDTPGLIAPDQNPGRDPARTPMQWNPGKNAGFTSDDVKTWLPVNGNHETFNVETQQQNQRSTLSFYRELLQLRKQSSALQQGSICFLDTGNDDILAYLRETDDERMLVVINFSGAVHTLDFSTLAANASYLLSSEMQSHGVVSIAEVLLSPYESILFKLGLVDLAS